jgi:hypothetical protein
MDAALVTKTEAKILILLGDDRLAHAQKGPKLNKLITRLSTPFTQGVALRHKVHATILRESMEILLG